MTAPSVFSVMMPLLDFCLYLNVAADFADAFRMAELAVCQDITVVGGLPHNVLH